MEFIDEQVLIAWWIQILEWLGYGACVVFIIMFVWACANIGFTTDPPPGPEKTPENTKRNQKL